MDLPAGRVGVVGLGAWCDLETPEEVRARLLGGRSSARPPVFDDPAEARPGLWMPAPVPSSADGDADESSGLAFRVEEFAVLADGRRVRLHADRGFSLSGPDHWGHLTLASLESDVRTTVLPDDAEDTGEDHPWDWLAELLRAQGIETSPEELRVLPYDVVFSDRLRARFPSD